MNRPRLRDAFNRYKEEMTRDRSSKPPWDTDPAPYDPAYGDPLVVDVADALDRGAVERAGALLDAAPIRRRRALWHRALTATDERVEVVTRALANHPEDPTLHSLAGFLLVEWAWEARGRGYAATVAPETWAVFDGRLSEAAAVLMRAHDLAPGSIEPWLHLLAVARGRQLGVEAARSCFDQAQDREPWEPNTCLAMIQNLAPKWGGTDDSMFEFAREVTASAPASSPAHGVVPMAYLELLVQRMRTLPEAEALAPGEGPDAHDELLAAAERSIFDPGYVTDAQGLRTADIFLLASYLGGHDLLSQRTIELMAGRYGEHPFDYFGDSGRMHRKVEILTARRLGLRRT